MSSKNLLSKWALKVIIAGILAIAPQLAHAQAASVARPIWMATSADQASLAGTGHGRLAIINGDLAYDSPAFSWRLALADIKRISASKMVSNGVEIEGAGGQRYFVGILDGQLTLASPGKAVQMIQRAVRVAPAPQPARTAIAAAAAGGGSIR